MKTVPRPRGERRVGRRNGSRRERDSNPRYRESPIRRFSKPVPSATRPSLQASGDVWPMTAGLLQRWPGHGHTGKTTIELFGCQPGGGGGIRTPGACARRFSRPLPSTARPLLQEPQRSAQYMDGPPLVKDHADGFCGGEIRSTPPTYGRRAGGTATEPSAAWYCSRIATRVRPTARPEPLRVWTGRGLSPAPGR